MKIKAKKIRIEFNDSSEDYWEASCESGLELDEAIRMITRAWEEHGTSAEPLIKDEKIRKAVRAWAEVNAIEQALYAERPNRSLCGLTDMGDEDYSIEFVGWIPTLKDGNEYTIAELCGEDEAPEPIEPTFIDLDERIKEKEEE